MVWTGTVNRIFVAEGQSVGKGESMLKLNLSFFCYVQTLF